MRILIDGYNLMHAKGLVPPGRLSAGLHHARRRFLDAVAERLGAIDRASTTVVFDAAHPPPDRAHETTYKDMTILYAVGDENADARVETLIAAHPAPRSLTVVSSDRRIRQAADRRRAKCIDSDEFWTKRPEAERAVTEAPIAKEPIDPRESAHWQTVFAGADEALRDAQAPGDVAEAMITQAEIDRIAREVERAPDLDFH
jgi:predicted RNA-binding protein with PIN domain